MRRVGRVSPVLIGIVAALVAGGCMPYSTKTTEVGVRTRLITFWGLLGEKGVEEKVYAPASTYFFVPFLNDWHTFDTRLTTLEMTAQVNRGDRHGRDALVFKTIDGNDINLDIVVSYRIDPAQAPKILREVATNDEELRENIIRTVTRSKPRDLFGELDTEEFYLADKRAAKAAESAAALNDILNPYGVIVERVGTGDYAFNPEYQQAIEQRKVADQEVERAKSATRAAETEYRAKVEEARGEVNRTQAAADGEFQRAKIEADANFERQKQLAEAIRIEGQAEAEAIRKMNEALAAPGGEAVVKLRIAEALKGKRIVLVPQGGALDVRSLNLNDFLQVYGLKELAVGGDTSKAAAAGR